MGVKKVGLKKIGVWKSGFPTVDSGTTADDNTGQYVFLNHGKPPRLDYLQVSSLSSCLPTMRTLVFGKQFHNALHINSSFVYRSHIWVGIGLMCASLLASHDNGWHYLVCALPIAFR